MKYYVISTSFDMTNQKSWVRLYCFPYPGKAESAEDFAKNELIEGYEMFVSPAMDIAFVKYHTGESYMIFCID